MAFKRSTARQTNHPYYASMELSDSRNNASLNNTLNAANRKLEIDTKNIEFELELLMYRIVVCCHVCSASGNSNTENDTSSISASALAPIRQDYLFVIKGVQLMLQYGVIGKPFVLQLQNRYNLDILRCVRLANCLYAKGVQCCSRACI